MKSNDLINTMTQFLDFATTPIILNGQTFPGGNARTAVIAPALLINPGAEATTVTVAAEAIQNVTYRMELPLDPPWTRAGVDKPMIKSALELQLGKNSAVAVPLGGDEVGPIDLEVKGLPSDAAFAQLVERHEDVHVKELQDTIEEILDPWDAMISNFKNLHLSVSGASEGAAEAEFYRTVGGTPEEIGERFVASLREKGIAFHATAAGGSPVISRVEKSFFGGTLKVYLRHAMS